MMMITTRSSIRVKPPSVSLLVIRFLSRCMYSSLSSIGVFGSGPNV
jgi:hypothetical protein